MCSSDLCCIGDGLIIDARPFRGVQQHPIEFGLENHSWILLRLKSQFNSVSADKQAASKAWLQSNIGKGYDWKGLAGFPLSREMDSKNRFYCSELCFGWKRQEGIILIERTPDGLVSPQNILGCPLLEVIDVDWKEKNQSIPGV